MIVLLDNLEVFTILALYSSICIADILSNLDTETVKIRLFGEVDMGDELYNIAYEYIQHISLFIPPSDNYSTEELEKEEVDFTVLNAL